MKKKWTRYFSTVYGIVSAVLYVGWASFIFLNFDTVQAANISILDDLFSIGLFSFLATILIYKRPDNRISWLFLLIALFRQSDIVRNSIQIMFAKGVEPTFWLVWFVILWPMVSGALYATLAYIMVLFPTGKFSSGRFRVARWLWWFNLILPSGVFLFLTYDLFQFFTGVGDSGVDIQLVPLVPTGPWASAQYVRSIPELNVFIQPVVLTVLITLVMAIFSLISQFRQGTYLVRQQIKWVLLTIIIWAIGLFLLLIPIDIPWSVLVIVSPLPPIAIAVAILRYRLLDIDLIIRRTLVYGFLTAMLAVIYFGSVALIQRLFTLVSGGDSPITVVISTLVLVISFAPLRGRIQNFIDRRFYRRKFDAELILAQFAETAQDELDLDDLSRELLKVVEETIQPETTSIWLAE